MRTFYLFVVVALMACSRTHDMTPEQLVQSFRRVVEIKEGVPEGIRCFVATTPKGDYVADSLSCFLVPR